MPELIDSMLAQNTPEPERRFIAGLAWAVGARVALETGTAEGGTALALSGVCEHVVTIDNDPQTGELVLDLENVTRMHGDALEMLPAALETAQPEFVLLDDSHDPEHVVAEMKIVLECTSVRAIVVHDALAREGLAEALKLHCSDVWIIDTGERPGLGVWLSHKWQEIKRD
ncbi:MAG: class I SAM-dependent methyltransferase [Dehalococcoidia bacterium]